MDQGTNNHVLRDAVLMAVRTKPGSTGIQVADQVLAKFPDVKRTQVSSMLCFLDRHSLVRRERRQGKWTRYCFPVEAPAKAAVRRTEGVVKPRLVANGPKETLQIRLRSGDVVALPAAHIGELSEVLNLLKQAFSEGAAA
jgi:hypothetical protein